MRELLLHNPLRNGLDTSGFMGHLKVTIINMNLAWQADDARGDYLSPLKGGKKSSLGSLQENEGICLSLFLPQ